MAPPGAQAPLGMGPWGGAARRGAWAGARDLREQGAGSLPSLESFLWF